MELKVGDIKCGQEIGKKPDRQRFIYAACEDCGLQRWVTLMGGYKPSSTLCKPCALHRRKGEKRGPAANRLDLVGQKFARLTVLKFNGISDKNGESLWSCNCDCGEVTITTGNRLTSGNTKSCGCYHKIRTRELFTKPLSFTGTGKVLSSYTKRAEKTGLPFGLSREEFGQLLQKDCLYCGGSPSNAWRVHDEDFIYQGIDRVDNERGYTVDNCVPCCMVCNKMKKAMPQGEFLNHIQKIHERCVTIREMCA